MRTNMKGSEISIPVAVRSKTALLLLFAFFIATIPLRSFAQKANTSDTSPRALVHVLDYIAQDYSGAVSNGKILKQSEFAEQKQFSVSAASMYRELVNSGNLKDNGVIGDKINDLQKSIDQKADPKVIADIAHDIKDKVIKATGMKVAPMKWPSLEKGKTLFAGLCTNCHGAEGNGKGKLAAQLDPKPTNFMSGKRITTLSPFQAFNTIRMGVSGTAMPSFKKLDDQEAWDLAFYIKSLQSNANHPDLASAKSGNLSTLRSKISLEQVATLNDQQLEKALTKNNIAKPEIALAELRLAGPKDIAGSSLDLARSYLNDVRQLYAEGHVNEARKKAVMAYLNGIEPVEPSLRAHAPGLIFTLEQQMTSIRSNIEAKVSAAKLNAAIQTADSSIQKASMVLQTKHNSPWFDYIMAASILLREGLEAFLIILAILGVINALGDKKAALWVHGGWILAVLFGVVAWFFTDWIISIGFGPVHRELMEGGVSLVAVVVLLYVGFWLHSKTEVNKWKEFIDVRVKNMLKGGNLVGLASIAFFAVFREALESVLFLSALSIEGGSNDNLAVGAGALTAILVVIILGALALRFSARLPLRKLFKYSSFMLGLLSVVLVGKGIHSLQEVGWLSSTNAPFSFHISLIGIYPTLQTIIAQLLILALLVVVWNYPKWKARRLYA